MIGNEIQLIDFKLAILSVWRNKYIILLITIAGLFAGMIYTSTKEIGYQYYANASVYCATYTTGTYYNLGTDTMVNYSDVVTSQKVCEYAASLVGNSQVTAEDIQAMLSVDISSSSYVMNIWVSNADQELAMSIANAVAQAFTSEMSNITDNESVQILDTATTTVSESSTSLNKIRMLYVLGALGLSVAFFGLRSLLSDKIRSVAQCADSEEEIIGIIPRME